MIQHPILILNDPAVRADSSRHGKNQSLESAEDTKKADLFCETRQVT